MERLVQSESAPLVPAKAGIQCKSWAPATWERTAGSSRTDTLKALHAHSQFDAREPCPAAIRPLDDDGQRPVARAEIPEITRTIGRMDAIQNLKTMAGSPDAGTAKAFAISVSQSCAWFLRFGVRAFVNHERQHYVQ
jgi:hypothetical protein